MSFSVGDNNIKARRILNKIERMQESEEFDYNTLEEVAKAIDKMTFVDECKGLLDVWGPNDIFEVACLLKDLNKLIDVLSKISDSGYYLDYIFNSSVYISEEVKKLGFTDEYLKDLMAKFEKLRSLLYGDCLDWNKISTGAIESAMYILKEENERLENRNNKLKERLE